MSKPLDPGTRDALLVLGAVTDGYQRHLDWAGRHVEESMPDLAARLQQTHDALGRLARRMFELVTESEGGVDEAALEAAIEGKVKP